MNLDQSEQILQSYERMLSFSEDELIRNILKLETDIESHGNYELLKRIHKSLLQYRSKQQDLIYIGFMGHFSSGKSSTINSLLNLTDHNAREVDLHPSDKNVTLITHKKNEPAFIKLVSYGSIAVKSVFIENDFLNNVVLIDTPGSGDTDPLLVNELMQDYLPVCDMLIYFISASNPIDKNDIPLLKELHKNLSLIPTKYTITRADEFRIDSDIPISSDNYDYKIVETFISKTISRINQYDELHKITHADFFVIDNKKKFQIEKLHEFITGFAAKDNLENQLKMHDCKIQLFRKTGIRIKKTFSLYVDNKLSILDSYVDEANENIKRYNDKVKITNNKLSQTWSNYVINIQKNKDKLLDEINTPLDNLSFCTELWDDEEIQTISTNLKSLIAYDSSSLAKHYHDKFLEEFILCIKKINDNLIDQLKGVNFSEKDISLNTLESPISEDVIDDLHVSKFFISKVNKLTERLALVCDNNKELISHNINSLTTKLNKGVPLPQYISIFNDAISGLNSDIDSHFDNVYLYRAGIFAEHVKEYISNLGIGQKLNELELEFDEDFKENVKGNAKTLIFEDFNSSSNVFEKTAVDLKARFDKIVKSFKSIEFNPWDQFAELPIADLSIHHSKDFKAELFDESVKQCQMYGVDVKKKIGDLYFENYQKLIEQKKAVRKRRIKRTCLFVTIPLIIAIPTVILTYVKFSETTLTNFFISLGASVVVTVASYLIGKITDKSEVILQPKIDELKSDFLIQSQRIMDDCKSIMSKKLFGEYIIRKHYILLLNEILKGIKNGELYIQANNLNKSYSEYFEEEKVIRAELISSIENITKAIISCFEYDDTKLDEISKSIKKAAIDPSFAFLGSLKTDIHNVKQKLQAIDFN